MIRKEGKYPPDRTKWTRAQITQAATNMLLGQTCQYCHKYYECPQGAAASSCWLWVEFKPWYIRKDEKHKRNKKKRENRRKRMPWNTGQPKVKDEQEESQSDS
jgi:hypothetical protein